MPEIIVEAKLCEKDCGETDDKITIDVSLFGYRRNKNQIEM